MLHLLHIENIAVIEEADIAFSAGFNALTGETGAGKSIVIDALGAVLGQRTSRDLIRTGASKAFVSAVFTAVPPLPSLAELSLIPEEGELLLQREIYADGKNACRINGKPVTVAQLRQIGGQLLNIHGQHDGQQLLDEEQHGAYLDSYGHVEGYLETYGACFSAMEETRRKIRSLQMDEAEKARRVDSLQFQIHELERAELKAGEEEALLQRRTLLRNSEKFLSAIRGALWSLSGGEEGGGAVSLLREAEDALAGARGLDEQFGQLYQRLTALYSEAYDVAETLRDLESAFDFSPQELDALESRADQLYRLKKKYGPTVDDMLDYLEQCRGELDRITFAADTVERLQRELQAEYAQVMKAAQLLSAGGLTALGPGWETAVGAHLILGIFNLLPVRPLDGGRALELAVSWRWDPEAGDRIARWTGAVAALALAVCLEEVMRRTGGSLWLLPALAGLLVAAGREVFAN